VIRSPYLLKAAQRGPERETVLVVNRGGGSKGIVWGGRVAGGAWLEREDAALSAFECMLECTEKRSVRGWAEWRGE